MQTVENLQMSSDFLGTVVVKQSENGAQQHDDDRDQENDGFKCPCSSKVMIALHVTISVLLMIGLCIGIYFLVESRRAKDQEFRKQQIDKTNAR